MATPRRRFFFVPDAILREDWSRDQRSTYMGLLAWFNTRRQRDGYTGKRAQEASIPPGDLLTITLSQTLEEARACVEELRADLKLKIEARGTFTFVRWPNLAKLQEWDRPSAARALPERCPSAARSGSGSGSGSGSVQKRERAAAPPALSAAADAADPEEIAPKGFAGEAARAWLERMEPQARDAVLARGTPADLDAAVREQLRRYARREKLKPADFAPAVPCGMPSAQPSAAAKREGARLLHLVPQTDASALARAVEGLARETSWGAELVELHTALLEGDGYADLRADLARGSRAYRETVLEVAKRQERAIALERTQLPMFPTPFEAHRARRAAVPKA